MSLNYLDKLIKRANKAMGKEVAAPLTTKKRKSLKKGTFCGPGRSFPVNDCAHYTAALRLLNRSKFSKSTKDKIRACVNRKGKAMSCGGANKAKSDIEELGINIDALIDSDVFATTRKLVEDSCGNPGGCLYPEGCDCEGDCTCNRPSATTPYGEDTTTPFEVVEAPCSCDTK